MPMWISMALFALAASITPGPVNIVALASGAQHGVWRSMRHVLGATVGFTALLLLTGLGLHGVLVQWPQLVRLMQFAGMAFLLFMAWKLATDDGRLGDGQTTPGPSVRYGAVMQWLNPKAWLAAVAGMATYAADGSRSVIWQFAAIYFVICYVSVGAWAYAGAFLRPYLRNARRVQRFNRLMAVLLALSALYLLIA